MEKPQQELEQQQTVNEQQKQRGIWEGLFIMERFRVVNDVWGEEVVGGVFSRTEQIQPLENPFANK